MFQIPDNWQDMSLKERQAARLHSWASPEMEFANPEAEQAFKQRTQMIIDVINLDKPERVPIIPWWGTFPAHYADVSVEDLMYDFEKLGETFRKFNSDFLPDALVSCSLIGPGKAFELLDVKNYLWPGHGTPPDTSYQCIENEFMSADEYDAFIVDPSNYFMRTYLPRVLGALGPWSMLNPWTSIVELPFVGLALIPVGLPPVQESFQTLLEAGQVIMEWITAVGPIEGASIGGLGLPNTIGSFTKAPFDILGDTLRGTRGIMLDMYRQPDKLLAALERLVPIATEMGVSGATSSDNPLVFIPLHKGADGFMSDKDFKKFYWPTLKAVLLGLIEAGTVPYLFVEGGYNTRLDIIVDADIPAGHAMWMFDQSDMGEVRKKLGGWATFGGNVPGSLLKTGTPQEVSDYVKKLIDDVAADGGYILANGAVLDDSTAENVHAMIDTGKEFGKY
jgi:hypothetical protein